MRPVKDGLGNKQSVIYSTLADNTVYTKGSNSQYPVIDAQSATPVVRQIRQPNAIGTYNEFDYTYADLDVHVRGLGSLGFRSKTVYDPILDIETTQTTALDPTFYVPIQSTSTRTFRGSGVNISSTSSSNEIDEVHVYNIGGNLFPRLLKSTISQVITEDYLRQIKTQTDFSIVDQYGNSELVTESIFNLSDNTLVQSRVSSYSFTRISNWWAEHLTESSSVAVIRSQVNPLDEETYVRTSSSAYHPNGSIHYMEDDMGVRTTFSNFSPVGQAQTKTVSASGLNTDVAKYTYDENYRHIIAITDDYNRTAHRVFHPVLDVEILSIDHFGRETGKSYSDLGRLFAIEDPYGNLVNHEVYWSETEPTTPSQNFLEATDVRYYTVESGPNHPTISRFHNSLGQPRKIQQTGHFGLLSTSFTTYNQRGQIVAQTEPHATDELNIKINTWSFEDPYGKLTEQKVVDQNGNPLRAAQSYQYSYDSTFKGYRQTTYYPDGTDDWRTTDAKGAVVASGDSGGILTFTYGSDGQQRKALLNGVVQSEMTYDQFGRQTSLDDADAGITEYRYDAYNRIIRQLDAEGNGYRALYNGDYGHLDSKQVFEEITLVAFENDFSGNAPTGLYSYTYELNGAAAGQLVTEVAPTVGGKEFSTSFTYNFHGRQESVTENIDGESYTSTTYFDQLGRVGGMNLPSGVEVSYGYNIESGFLESKTADDGTVLWQAIYQDAQGRYTNFNRGALDEFREFDNLGYPTRIQTGSIQDLEISWHANSGNLKMRSESASAPSQYEHFNHDGLDRLTQWKVTENASDVDWSAEICKVSFATTCNGTTGTNGNILEKIDAGVYSYAATHPDAGTPIPHAVHSVSDPLSLASSDPQIFIYTPFNSVSQIVQGVKKLDLFYGSDDQRRLSIFEDDGVEMYHRQYVGSYERQDSPDGSSWEVQYIQGSSATCAIFVKQNAAEGQWYFPLVDHLGSILGVYDSEGNLVSESLRNFDAWGRYRDVDDWDLHLENSPLVDGSGLAWMWRGYTGHEHHDEFGIINMNGRCYDPLVGRMLSPDNNVQLSYNTQNYNRYSYVLNNPLRLSDPSGEDFFDVIFYPFKWLTEVTDDREGVDWDYVKHGRSQSLYDAYNDGAGFGFVGIPNAGSPDGFQPANQGEAVEVDLTAITGAAYITVGNSTYYKGTYTKGYKISVTDPNKWDTAVDWISDNAHEIAVTVGALFNAYAGIVEMEAGAASMLIPTGFNQVIGVYGIGDGVARVIGAPLQIYGTWTGDEFLEEAPSNVLGAVGYMMDNGNPDEALVSGGDYQTTLEIVGDAALSRKRYVEAIEKMLTDPRTIQKMKNAGNALWQWSRPYRDTINELTDDD